MPVGALSKQSFWVRVPARSFFLFYFLCSWAFTWSSILICRTHPTAAKMMKRTRAYCSQLKTVTSSVSSPI